MISHTARGSTSGSGTDSSLVAGADAPATIQAESARQSAGSFAVMKQTPKIAPPGWISAPSRPDTQPKLAAAASLFLPHRSFLSAFRSVDQIGQVHFTVIRSNRAPNNEGAEF